MESLPRPGLSTTPNAGVCGSWQRCHHGATGVLLTGVAVAGLGANRRKSAGVVTLAATGSVLMMHDWKDRQIWFERGWGTQP